MELLFDHNLSPRLVDRLDDEFSGSTHTGIEGLARASDEEVWSFAREAGYAIVTKDSDFNDLVTLRGSPPKVLWIRIGNCTTDAIERLLRTHVDAIRRFGRSEETDLLELQ